MVVQEILTILSEVIPGQEQLVDVDYRWFDPKVYLGSYQVKPTLVSGNSPEGEGGEGFLTNRIVDLVRYSHYTIVADPNVPVGQGSIFTVDNCNFGLVTVSLGVPPVVVTAQKPIVDQAIFSGNTSIQRAPLKDTDYSCKLASVGLYYNPGCQPSQLFHRIAIINTISTDYDNFPNFACVPLGGIPAM